jgi:hypothetical protein
VTLALAAALGCAGCASAESTHTIARVGGVAITTATLAHRMAIVAPEHVVPDPPRYTACIARLRSITPHGLTAGLARECRDEYAALKREALDHLISSQWLIGEASGEGLGVSDQAVAHRLQQKKASFANGSAEDQESLTVTARTPADLEFETRTELAKERIRQALAQHEPKVTRAQTVAYYRRNISRYRTWEQRRFYIVENLESAASARRLTSEFACGEKHIAAMSLRESLDRRNLAGYTGEKRRIADAIFAAKPHVVAEPVELNHYYFLFEVTRVTPAYVKPLAQVRAAIARQLADEAQKRRLVRFVTAWRTRWIAKTDCSPGYVIQKCAQYNGHRVPEDPHGLN